MSPGLSKTARGPDDVCDDRGLGKNAQPLGFADLVQNVTCVRDKEINQITLFHLGTSRGREVSYSLARASDILDSAASGPCRRAAS